MPGYEELDPCPTGDPLAAPDLERARDLIAEADAEGAESAEVKAWGPLGGASEKAATAVADAWTEIGLDASPELVDFAVYVPTIGNADTGAQARILDFFQDFPHPANYLQNFSGEVITERNNLNFSRADDPELTGLIEDLKTDPSVDPDCAVLSPVFGHDYASFCLAD